MKPHKSRIWLEDQRVIKKRRRVILAMMLTLAGWIAYKLFS